MIAVIKWKDPQLLGAVIAAVIGLIGVLFTVFFKKKDPEGRVKKTRQQQTSLFGKNNNQLQAGRDIKFKDQNNNPEREQL